MRHVGSVCECDWDGSGDWTQTGDALLSGQTCVEGSQANRINGIVTQSSAVEMNYFDVKDGKGSITPVTDIGSAWIRDLYLQSAVHCYYYQPNSEISQRACEALGNMCVLQLYNPASGVCEMFGEIYGDRSSSTNNQDGWRTTLPWLEYEDSRRQVTGTNALKMLFTFANGDIGSTLSSSASNGNNLVSKYAFIEMFLGTYTLNGTWLGFEALGTQFHYCPQIPGSGNGPSFEARWLKFGVSQAQKGICDLEYLIQNHVRTHSIRFYDLWILDRSIDSSDSQEMVLESLRRTVGDVEGPTGTINLPSEGILYPCPVKINNYRQQENENAVKVNENRAILDETNDVLHRRFFLFDVVSGLETAEDTVPRVVRYASSIKLQIKTQQLETEAIQPPLLTIEYSERQPGAFYKSDGEKSHLATDEIAFFAEYYGDTEEYWSLATSFFIFVIVVALFSCLVKLYNKNRQPTFNGEGAESFGESSARMLIYFMASFAACFFWFLYVNCAYWYIFFKLQDTVYVLLPKQETRYGTDDDYYVFKFILQTCWVFQSLAILEIIYTQCNAEIFFMDWEKSTGKLVDENFVKTYDAPVSVWRTLLVANEWNELQAMRRADFGFTLIFVAFVLIGMGQQYLATPQPDEQDYTPGNVNMILRFFIDCSFFMAFGFGQVLWKWAVQDRCFTEPKPDEFIDMCTIAKVSVFILDERYHGYYLHCRSPYPAADGNMIELVHQLEQESKGLTTDRGLDDHGSGKGQQAFEVFVTGSFREQYDKIYAKLRQKNSARAARESGALGLGSVIEMKHNQTKKNPPQSLVNAYTKLNVFLKGFIDQSDSTFKRDMREKNLSERILNLPPDMQSTRGDCIMYPDRDYNFTKVLFYGKELDLLIFNMLTFGCMELWTNNVMTAVMLTYLGDQLMCFIRMFFGGRNIAEKTLVDQRFLI